METVHQNIQLFVCLVAYIKSDLNVFVQFLVELSSPKPTHNNIVLVFSKEIIFGAPVVNFFKYPPPQK